LLSAIDTQIKTLMGYFRWELLSLEDEEEIQFLKGVKGLFFSIFFYGSRL